MYICPGRGEKIVYFSHFIAFSVYKAPREETLKMEHILLKKMMFLLVILSFTSLFYFLILKQKIFFRITTPT